MMSDKNWPKYQVKYALGSIRAKEFIALSTSVCSDLQWKINFVSDTGLIAFTQNGLLKWNAEFWIVVENGEAEITAKSVERDLTDQGQNKALVHQFIERIEAVIPHINQEALDGLSSELKTGVIQTEEELRKQPLPSLKEQILDFLRLLLPNKIVTITPILLDLNILIFILMVLSGVSITEPDGESLLRWGANYKPLVVDGEVWRLLSCCFIHIGIMHLLFNMYALLYIGLMLEPLLGKRSFLLSYLVSGVVASAVSLWWHDHGLSAGASGAIFGMYGVFIPLLLSNLIEKHTRKSLLASILIFVLFNLANGLSAGIDNAAHIGGLLCGILIGILLLPGIRKRVAAQVQ